MISLEMARKLRDAGLEWEPLAGDFYSWCGRNWLVDFCQTSQAEILASQPDPALWLPRLDQLLAEIEKRGWEWTIYSATPENVKSVDIYEVIADEKLYHCSVAQDKLGHISGRHTPDDAAAEALLWILSQKEA